MIVKYIMTDKNLEDPIHELDCGIGGNYQIVSTVTPSRIGKLLI